MENKKKVNFNLKNMSDTNLLLTITIVIFFLMYIGAMLFLKKEMPLLHPLVRT